MDTDPILEEVMRQLGDWGKYQFRQHVYHILAALLAGMHMLSLTMVAPTPPHRCRIEELDDNSSGITFSPSALQSYIPVTEEIVDSCHKYEFGTNDTVSCRNGSGYVYDDTYHSSSNVINWNLVCEERYWRALLQSFYMGGVLLGALILGPMADKYGRKTIFYVSGLVQLFAGLACAYITNFSLYCGMLVVYGLAGSGGAYVTGFVLTMELVGPSMRTFCGTAFSAAFAFGVMLDAVWGYFITNVVTLQTILALHSMCLIAHWWLVDESIRWLWGQGRRKDALKIAERAAITNGVKFDDKVEMRAECPENEVEGSSFGASDLFKTRNLRIRTFNVAFNWFSNSLVYYGLSLNTGNLPGNPFIILFLMGLAELPGYLIVMLFVDKTGRRCLCSFLMFMGGFACIVVAFIPKGIFVTSLVLVGKMAIAGSFAIIYNYTAELFPTVVRNSAVGLGATAARFSGALTPLLTLLDSVDKELPTIIFGAVAVASAICTLFLPETLNKEMPQTIEDGERFGVGDNAYKNCFNLMNKRKPRREDSAENFDQLNPK